jgi:hypothetical protein
MTLRHLQRINLSLRISSPKLDIYTTKVSKWFIGVRNFSFASDIDHVDCCQIRRIVT